jgi:hypothetical protein
MGLSIFAASMGGYRTSQPGQRGRGGGNSSCRLGHRRARTAWPQVRERSIIQLTCLAGLNVRGFWRRPRRLLPVCLYALLLACRFPNPVSSPDRLTCGYSSCLTPCHRAFVSNSCHFLGGTDVLLEFRLVAGRLPGLPCEGRVTVPSLGRWASHPATPIPPSLLHRCGESQRD